MGRYPVTQEQYSRFLSAIGCQESEFWGEINFNDRLDPAVGVSWHDAKEYAKWAGMQLPSEAQWEYSCRAGTTTRYYNGDSEADLTRAGWYRKNSNNKLHPVGEKEPNPFGLYDMHGNVWEWCEDHWHPNYEGAPDNDSAWVDFYESCYRVVRGGSWSSFGEGCRTACRDRHEPNNRFLNFGFRLVYLPGQLVESVQFGKRDAKCGID
jgi:formylglycine-generating enzyme required for sulfatase activity